MKMPSRQPTNHVVMPSPIGPLTLVGRNGALHALYMGDLEIGEHRHAPPRSALGPEDDTGLNHALEQLEEYFAGRRRIFDLPLDVDGTAWQQLVWAALGHIGYGVTRSYSQVAADIGRPSASRAVGTANGRNPVSIVIPCHRVIGAGGSLTAYGAGLERKAHLLAMEQQVLAASP